MFGSCKLLLKIEGFKVILRFWDSERINQSRSDQQRLGILLNIEISSVKSFQWNTNLVLTTYDLSTCVIHGPHMGSYSKIK